MGIGYMALWGFGAKRVTGWVGYTYYTVTTTRAPAVLINEDDCRKFCFALGQCTLQSRGIATNHTRSKSDKQKVFQPKVFPGHSLPSNNFPANRSWLKLHVKISCRQQKGQQKVFSVFSVHKWVRSHVTLVDIVIANISTFLQVWFSGVLNGKLECSILQF